jgi:Tfp pilus assembly protein PilO
VNAPRGLFLAWVATVSAALPLAAYWTLVRPSTLASLAQGEKRLDEGSRELRALEITANKLEEFKRESALLDEQLAVLERIRPTEVGTGPLFERLREIAASDHLTVIETNTLHEGDERVLLSMRLSGTPDAFAAFAARLPRLARFLVVERVELERRGDADFDFRLRFAAFRTKT